MQTGRPVPPPRRSAGARPSVVQPESQVCAGQHRPADPVSRREEIRSSGYGRLARGLLWAALLAVPLLVLLTLLSRQVVAEPEPNDLTLPNTTPITDDILTDTVWTLAQSPYLVQKIQVKIAASATLTVEPGVEVQFAQSTGMLVEGNLVAVGTVTQPITFTGSTETPGWWDGIRIQGDLQGDIANLNRGSRFSHVTIAYGGNSYANLVLDDAHATVEASTFLGSGRHGIYTLDEGVVDVRDSRFISNTDYALMLNMGALDPVLTGLQATGNGQDAVGLWASASTDMTGDYVWENPGIPYQAVGHVILEKGATLTVDPGVEVRFDQNRSFIVYGNLLALGTASQPITFTGTTQQPGWWDGLHIVGTPDERNLGNELSYVTLEYAGLGQGNLEVDDAQVRVDHSIIRHSANNGIYADRGSVVAVWASQIVDNADYGVWNHYSNPPLRAEYNWWGDASGPWEASTNPSGAGDKVNFYVFYSPFLTAPDEEPPAVAPGKAAVITIEPVRWYVPADGFPGWVTITLRDGAGNPMPGYRVNLATNLGHVTDGGLTDASGRTFAYVTSDTPGEAELIATLDGAAYHDALPATTTITFYDPLSGLAPDLAADVAAPYATDAIEITPLPIVQGISTTISVNLTNPNDFPIVVTGTFGIAQLGIGLTFGPLGGIQSVEIPAQSTRTIGIIWTPTVSGKYCVDFNYSWAPTSQAGLASPFSTSGGHMRRNLSVFPGTLEPQHGKEILEKARQATELISYLTPAPHLIIPKGLLRRGLGWMFDIAAGISWQLGGDPPRQDYRAIAMPQWLEVSPVLPSPDVSQARADAVNALTDGILDIQAYGNAALISLDRYGGAAAAGSLTWSAQQASAVIYYRGKVGQAMLDTADAVDDFAQVLENEEGSPLIITVAEVRAYQDRLRTQGWTAEEIQAARELGLTDAQIEALRQDILAQDPVQLAGDLLQKLREAAQALREAGATLVAEQNYASPAGLKSSDTSATPNNLVQVYRTQVPIRVGNPATVTDTISLKTRPLGLPLDWSVSVSPASVTLGPGEAITATVTIVPGGPTAQGTVPRVAVEGFNSSDELIGGVVVDVVAPAQGNFDGQLHVYLPVVQGP